MALQAIVDTIESVPEALRGEYVEKDGKFHLNLEGGENLPFVTGLKRALDSERSANKSVKDKVTAWERLGKSPDEIDELLTAERTKAEDALKKAGKFDEVLATHLGKAKKERDEAVGAADKKTESALSIARRAVVNTSLATALATAKATAEGMKALPRLIGDRVKIEFNDAHDAVASIFDADGKTPMVGSGSNGLATFDDLVKEAVKSFPSLFEGSGAGGGGTPPKNGSGGSGGKTLTLAEFHALQASDPRAAAAKMKDGFKVVD